MQSGSHIARQKFVLWMIFCMWAALTVNTGIIQVLHHDLLYQKSVNQSTEARTLKATRGSILDRNGMQLAVTMTSASYGVWPRKVKDKEIAAHVLSGAAGMSEESVMNLLKSDKKYQYLIRHADMGTMRKMDAVLDTLDSPLRVKIKAFERVPEYKRYYPLGRIGAHVIGYTDIDSKGIEGLEKFFDRDLSGSDGRSLQLRDAMLRTDKFLSDPIVKAQNGLDMYLTIDWRIQEIAEEELEEAVTKSQAKYGGVIVMDSGTGEILAMANVPRFDPNDPASFNSLDPNCRRNRLVTDMLEPGSTFKIVTFAEALETGVIKEDDPVNCMGGSYTIGSHTIGDAHKMGVVPARDVLIHSSNIGTVMIAERFGKQRLYERARLFGFGEVTGSDFPSETRGRLPNPITWSNLSLPTIAFGQGVAVSPMQLAAAYAAIANGGEYLSPRIIRDFRDKSGEVVRPNPERRIRRVMTVQTAARLTELLCEVVEVGTGTKAAVPGVRIAGKTGTAQRISEGSKGYANGKYVPSFVGFIADRNPRLVCLVMIDTPEVGSYYGAQVSAPVFKNIINRIMNMGGSPVNGVLANGTASTVKTVLLPSMKGLTSIDAANKLRALGLNSQIVGDPAVVMKQFPLAGAELNRGSNVTLYTNTFTAAHGDSISVPNLTGVALREAVQNLVQANLKVKVSGSGIVETQNPEPGTLVVCGTVCEIACRKR